MNVAAPALNLAPLLDVQGCCKSFRKPDGDELVVLDNVNLTLRPGEIVGLLGRSGSGKSTLLRAIAGLDKPSAGVVNYLGHPVTGPAAGIAMVFQSFALFPWLTVLENVQLGLEALGMPEPEMRRRSLQAIDLIGLDGFESAYPRELSGGMRQRVGFARALVVHPNVLLMDEPFSALDVLTAETLRSDFLNLWGEGQLPIKAVLLVTHNIEEAVEMCDRLLIFSTNPGRVVGEIPVDLPQPRHALDPRFRALVERVYVEMTAKPRGERVGPKTERFPGTGIGTTLTHVSSNVLAGLMEAVSEPPYDGQADLPAIAQAQRLEVDDLFPVLSSPVRTVAARHLTLQATVDWSYQLLLPQEQVAFRRFSVFVGDFDLEAAGAVLNEAPPAAISRRAASPSMSPSARCSAWSPCAAPRQPTCQAR